MKDKMYYMHALFDLMTAANLRQIKAICAVAGTLVNERIGAGDGHDIHNKGELHE